MIGLSVIPLPYRILATVALLAATVGGSFYAGDKHAREAAALHEQAAVSKALAANAQIKAAADAQAQADAQARADLQTSLANANEQLRLAERASAMPAGCNLDKARYDAINRMLSQ